MRGSHVSRSLFALLFVAALGACSNASRASGGRVVRVDRPDFPLLRARPDELSRFQAGDELFEVTMREPDGLGPLYIRASCGGCHAEDGRGPGFVRKMTVPDAGIDSTALPHGNTERPYTTAGATTPLVPPEDRAIATTRRFPPAVFARGYVEAVADDEIERVAREASERLGPIRGRIHRVRYDSEANPRAGFPSRSKGESNLIGRFGLKARIASIDEFCADALQGDMGITSPLRPSEPPNPEGLTDDEKPGVDVSADVVNLLADYVRLLEIPERARAIDAGPELFRATECASCHVPALRTRADYPIEALAGVEAPLYSDLLLHDMGTGLADGVTDGDAGPREWRTAPLIGLRFFPALLHDGRASSVEQAVLAHRSPGSEANESVGRYLALAEGERRLLLAFVESL
jgi:CxxC motif-containing protein (DUF1111 family)